MFGNRTFAIFFSLLIGFSLVSCPQLHGQGKKENQKAPDEPTVNPKFLELIDFDASVDSSTVTRGGVIQLKITGTPNRLLHAYTYPMTVRSTNNSPGQLAEMTISSDAKIQRIWPVEESNPVAALFEIGDDKEYPLEHKEPFTWKQEIYVPTDAAIGKHNLNITIKLQVCTEGGSCYPFTYPTLTVPFEIDSKKPIEPTKTLKEKLAKPQPAVSVITVNKVGTIDLSKISKSPTDPTGNTDTTVEKPKRQGLLSLLGFAVIGALAMLLTPCVFPMIPVTVNFFIKQSEKEHHKPFFMASVYSGTIVLLLTSVILLFGGVVVTLANDPWFNLAMGGVLIFFALSLFGMYELGLPSFLSSFTSSQEGKGGMIGTIFMAITFTITSFTCTGPFLGILLAPVASVRPPLSELILLSLVYSITFAAPFFLLAVFPSLLKSLPKSGGWMNVIKVTMGFVEVAAAMKFFANSDMTWTRGEPFVMNNHFILCGWIALSFLCGLYLLGVFCLPHDDSMERIGVVRMLFACLFVGFGIYLVPFLFNMQKTGPLANNIIAILPQTLGEDTVQLAKGGNGSDSNSDHKEEWLQNYTKAWQKATKDGGQPKPMFIDFTGVNCPNCRYNEGAVFPRAEVQKLLEGYVKVQLYTDTVKDKSLSYSEAKAQAKINERWRNELGQTIALPAYVIFQPDPTKPFTEDGLPNGKVLGRTEGQINDVPAFVRLLEENLPSTKMAQAGS